jgi:2-oxoisovalerate dehydrogenase E1 component
MEHRLDARIGKSLRRLIASEHTPTHLLAASPLSDWLSVYQWMSLARAIDEAEAALVAGGEAFFHLSSTGHETNAVFGLLLTESDWLHLHYRSKALLVARGMPVESFFHNMFCTGLSQSAGRQMAPFASDPARHILSQNIPVGDHVLQAVGIAAELGRRPESAAGAIVLCSMGEGATQQGEVMEGLSEAARARLPVLFVVEDNGYAISTPTASRTLLSTDVDGHPPEHVLGLPVHRLDGRDPVSCLAPLARIVNAMRQTGQPALVELKVERLASHSNADDERVYRPATDRERAQHGDPIKALARHLADRGMKPEQLAEIDADNRLEVRSAVDRARRASDPSSVAPARAESISEDRPGKVEPDQPRSTMIEAIRSVLRHRLATDRRVTLSGQDIEDPKGDVFGVTRGLSTDFPGRVLNAALSESLIVGTAIGRALAGGRPVAFIQFADFLPLAFNQIHSELGSLFWRTAGGWNAPVIVMVACGGYRPGLGPFHAQSLESVFAHVPGINVVMPSTADDAAGLLQSAFDSPTPTLFFYPKVCLNDPDRAARVDAAGRRIRLGRARQLRSGDELTLVSWGSTMPLVEHAADTLAAAGVSIDVIDIRSLSPWDKTAVRQSVRKTGKLIVVHEDNLTCGFGAEVVADVAEAVDRPVKARRVTRPDTYICCNFASHLETLPSFRRILTVAGEMLDLTLDWPIEEATDGETQVVEAIGSSPADQTIRVVEWKVREGDRVRPGQTLAELEADKALYPLGASAAGQVIERLIGEGDPVRPGTPILKLRLDQVADFPKRRIARQDMRVPRVSRKSISEVTTSSKSATRQVALQALSAVTGSRTIPDAEAASQFPDRAIEDFSRRTGIKSRKVLAEGETILDLAVTAARKALEQAALALTDIHAIICSTGTSPSVTPSLACLILERLGKELTPAQMPAFDLTAACTGYLYALAIAHDMIQVTPGSRVLVITAEGMSRLVNPHDFDTAMLFGDAATATVLSGSGHTPTNRQPLAILHRPTISAKGEPGKVISLHAQGGPPFVMDGLRVYAEAVRQMTSMLQSACAEHGVSTQDLSLVVPHQANAKIMEDVRLRLGIPLERVATTVEWSGNTSSSSIPLALAELANACQLPPGLIGLTAFGGGYTFGAALLETPS